MSRTGARRPAEGLRTPLALGILGLAGATVVTATDDFVTPDPSDRGERRLNGNGAASMHELGVDFVTSLDGFRAAGGWPGWWGLEGS